MTLGSLNAEISDNYFDLLPGEPVTITITGKASLPDVKKQIQVISLIDAFPAQSEQASAAPAK